MVFNNFLDIVCFTEWNKNKSKQKLDTNVEAYWREDSNLQYSLQLLSTITLIIRY